MISNGKSSPNPNNRDRDVVLSTKAREDLHCLNHSLGHGCRFKGKTFPDDLDQALIPEVITGRILSLDHSIGEHHQYTAWP